MTVEQLPVWLAPYAIKNVEALLVNADHLQYIHQMVLRCEKFKQHYEGRVVSGTTFANMANGTFEDIYPQDIIKYRCFPWEYYNGVFLDVEYKHIYLSYNLGDIRIKITKISVGGTYFADAY
ncbi:hypothetical protein C0W54_07440 [Photobacterium kishitanii]|uniref:hypothetical protein n=1 Tax=Photobacterium kishitanii TaxID=318456 RepID=UPI000D1664E5|nr:hypothetical protein [Photobacterium kishitanii]PSW62156.1 hypothetical protein C0W54_07440 [Photobacterium kishitanii]